MDEPGREAVARRLAALADAGRLGSEQVRSAAGALGVSERTVWRWVGQARAGEGDRPLFRYFAGAAGSIPLAVVPDQLISEPTPLTVGGTSWSCIQRQAGKPQTR